MRSKLLPLEICYSAAQEFELIAPSSVMLHLHEKGSLEQDLDCPVPPPSALEAFSPVLCCYLGPNYL